MTGLTAEIAKNLVKQGRSIQQIAQDFGICPQAVRYHLNKPSPPPKPARNYNALIEWRL